MESALQQRRQRDHASEHGQNDRAELFSKIIQNVQQDP